MKKIISLTMIMTLAMTNVVFTNTLNNSEIILATEQKVFDSDILNSYVLARSMSDEFGFELDWDNEEKVLTMKKDNNIFKVTVGSKTHILNDRIISTEEPVIIIDSRVYIPLSAYKQLEQDYGNNVEDVQPEQDFIDSLKIESELIVQSIIKDDFLMLEEKSDGVLSEKLVKPHFDYLKSNIGEFNKIDYDKLEIIEDEEESVGKYVKIDTYLEYENSGLVIELYYDYNSKPIGITANYYNLDINDEDVLPESIEEIDYKIGIEGTQNAKLTRLKDEQSDTVVILVSGSGPNDYNEKIAGIKPFQDIAWGLAEEGIDSFRFDKVTYSILNGDIKLENPETFTVKEEYLYDVEYITDMLLEMGYENIYLLGHSQGGMLAPRLYEANDEVYEGLIILAGTPKTFTDVIIAQFDYAIENTTTQYSKKVIIDMANEAKDKIEQLENYTDEELSATYISNLNAYYLKEMNDFDTGEIIKGIDKPILILQGGKDFQVFKDLDYEAWKVVLENNEKAQFKLYDNLSHLFTLVPENANNDFRDYIQPAKVEKEVIDDIIEFINKK